MPPAPAFLIKKNTVTIFFWGGGGVGAGVTTSANLASKSTQLARPVNKIARYIPSSITGYHKFYDTV